MPITVKAARITGAARFEVGLPTQGTPGAAGYDLQNAWDEPVTLQSGERLAFPVGLRFEIPPGYEGQVRPRSGLALSKGVTVLNAPGTIDSDYRGEVRVILINHGRETVVIAPGERIAQLVIAPVTATCFAPVFGLGDTERGEGGFGSTGAGVPAQNRDAHAAGPAGSGALTSNERRHCIDLVVGMQSKLEQLLALLGGAK